MSRPNLLVILSDQLRRCALGAYGDPNVHTPNIDALAERGARFTNASSTYPVCVPFRFSLMTGEYAHTRWVPSIEWRMSPAERTLADEFNDAGYDTAWFGKWHLYNIGGSGLYPTSNVVKASRTPIPRLYQGRWQRFAGFDICNDPFDTYYVNEADPTLHKIDGYQTDGLTDLVIDYLRADRPDPFAAVLSVEPPHPLFTAPPEYLDRWRDRELVLRDNVDLSKDYNLRSPHSNDLLDDLRVYYAMVENLDDNVGRLVTALRETGRLDDTVIVMLADHGELLGSHGLLAKQRPYEESIGIPLIVSGPPIGQHARVIDDPVCTEDLFPTLLGLTGLAARDPKPGVDLSALIRGEQQALDRDGVLLEFVAELRRGLPFFDEPWRGFRSQRYKYTVVGDGHGGAPWQFFDLDNDPYEQHNLVDDPKHADEIRRHHQLLRERLVETDDHYVLKPAYDCAGLNEWDPEARFPRRFG